MKSPTLVLSLLILLVGFGLGFAFHGFGESVVEAQGPFRGAEVCFQVEGPTGPILRLQALNLGNNHYLLSGRILDPSDPSFIEPIFGNLEIKSGQLHMTFVSARSATGMPDDTVSTGFFNSVVLDAQTLQGNVESLGIEHDTVGDVTRLDHGTPVSVNRVSCP